MKILITGASGLLGRYLLKTQPYRDFEGMGKEPEHDIYPCYFTNKIEGGIKLDISDPIETIFEINPDIIIHCAANGDVDSVENNPSKAVKSDLLGTIKLVDYCEKMKCKLVTISSNAVYDGDNPPYSEDSPRNPVNLYGKIKSLADDIVMKSKCDWVIIRPIFMYGWPNKNGRGNWATKIIESKEVKLVVDIYTQPTYAGDVAKWIWDVIYGDGLWCDHYNLSSKDVTSIYTFGEVVNSVFDLDCKILQSKISDFKTIAPRPVNTCFEDGLSMFHDIKTGLTKMKNET